MRRPRILFLTHRLPYAPNRGDRIRAYHTLRVLRTIADVHVLSMVHDEEEASHANEVQAIASSIRIARVTHWANRIRAVPALPTSVPLTHVLLHSPEMARHIDDAVAEAEPDLVFAYCSGIADHVLRPPIARLPLVVDMVDVDSGKWASLAQRQPSWHPLRFVYSRESRVLSRFEAALTAHARVTTVINDRERALLVQLAPGATVRTVGNGVDFERLQPPDAPAAEPRVVFCGVMNYQPNEQGMLWFIDEVWPRVRAQRGDASLQVVGAHPTARLLGAGRAAPGVTITGSVAAVEPFLWRSAVSVAPLFVARGMQNKVIEALAAGLPVVVTPEVAEGLPSSVIRGCTQAADPETFAREVVHLLELTPEQRRARAREADVASLSWQRTLQPLVDIVQSLLERN